MISRAFKWRGTKLNKRTGIHQQLNKIGGGVLTKAHIPRHSGRRADRPILSPFTIMSRDSQASLDLPRHYNWTRTASPK